MTMVQWSEDYSVGIDEIDQQHRVLVGLINELYVALAEKGSQDKIGAVLDRLVEYTKVHFAVEECLMRVFNFPGYEAHRQVHGVLVAQVVEVVEKFRAGDGRVGMELLFLLKDWLIGHIKEKDTGYAPYLIRQGMFKRWTRRFW